MQQNLDAALAKFGSLVDVDASPATPPTPSKQSKSPALRTPTKEIQIYKKAGRKASDRASKSELQPQENLVDGLADAGLAVQP